MKKLSEFFFVLVIGMFFIYSIIHGLNWLTDNFMGASNINMQVETYLGEK